MGIITLIPRISDYISKQETPFYDGESIINSSVPDFIKENDFQIVLTGVIDNLYGSYAIRKKFILDGEVVPAMVQTKVMFMYAMNAYKYQKLYDTLNLEYNPLDNVDEVDHWTEAHSGEDVNTQNVGSKTSHEKLGNRSDSMTVGGSNDTETHSVAPYETSSYKNKEQNNISRGGHTDSSVIGAQDNQYIEGAQENKDTLEHGHLITYDRRRHGNIGVTTAAQLIAGERQTADFSLYKLIATDIKNLLCIGVLN